MHANQKIQFEDLPPDFQDLADEIGFEATVKRIESRGGGQNRKTAGEAQH